MTILALVILFTSSAFNVAWNIAAKKSDGSASFLWTSNVVSIAMYAFIILGINSFYKRYEYTTSTFLVIAVGASFHIFYYLILLRAYQVAHFSMIYPLVRGMGQLTTVLLAIVLFAERPSTAGYLGIALVLGGVFFLSFDHVKELGKLPRAGLLLAVATACTIPAYTLWDAHVVTVRAIPPFHLHFGYLLARVLLLTPHVLLARRREVRRNWRESRRQVFIVGVLSPLSYVLLLVALWLVPVSYAVPAREVGIVLAVVAGAIWFGERITAVRVVSSVAIAAGVAAMMIH